MLFVKDGYNYRKVDEGEIVFAESDQNYVRLQLGDGSSVNVRTTISEFPESLTPNAFLRVHRSFLVAVGKVTGIEGSTLVAGQYSVPIGKNFRDEVLKVLGIRK
jgi:DNA-binding LytR/AlgR family response regulator